MKGNLRSLKAKEGKLLNLYSRWHETRDERFKRQSLKLLEDILKREPNFEIRNDFQFAF